MKKLVGLLILGLVAAPAMADWAGNNGLDKQGMVPVAPHGSAGVYGLHTTAGPVIYLDFKMPAAYTDTILVTFGAHWPYITSVTGAWLSWTLVYDNSEVEIVNLGTAFGGQFGGGQILVSTWPAPNPSAGIMALAGYVTATVTPHLLTGSGVFPFLQVQFHVKDAIEDSANDMWMATVKNWASHIFPGAYPPYTSYWWTNRLADTGLSATRPWLASHGFDVTPEPASMLLLLAGVAGVGGGIWRRRR
jgi:hypothetical protein